MTKRIVENSESRQILRDFKELGPKNMIGMTYNLKVKDDKETDEGCRGRGPVSDPLSKDGVTKD